MIDDIHAWCRGKSWLARLPVWLYLLYVGVQQYENPEFWSIFSGINFGIHEGGHILLRPFGDLPHVAGGTLLQLAAPIAAMVILGKQPDYFGVAFGFGWLSTNMIGVGYYMADARAQALPLATAEGGGGVPMHDWNYLFGRFGLLPYDETIGLAVRGAAVVVMLAALVFGAWLMLEMAWPTSRASPTKGPSGTGRN
jgi:hypothetical protein